MYWKRKKKKERKEKEKRSVGRDMKMKQATETERRGGWVKRASGKKLPWPGFEPGLLRPQRRVLTTRRSRPTRTFMGNFAQVSSIWGMRMHLWCPHGRRRSAFDHHDHGRFIWFYTIAQAKVSRDTFHFPWTRNFLFSVFRVVQGEARTPRIMGRCRAIFCFFTCPKDSHFWWKLNIKMSVQNLTFLSPGSLFF